MHTHTHTEPIFGHLHIVFRDWTYEGDADSVHKTLFTIEQCTYASIPFALPAQSTD
jgi:hypothetical protein